MLKRKRADRASARPRRPAPESNDVKQSGGEKSPPGTPDAPPGPSTMERLLLKDEKDATDFLDVVEEYFKDVDPNKHDVFVDLLVAQKHAAVGHPCFISQVKELFRGHTDMLKFFNEVLEPDYKILFNENVPEIQDLAKLYVAKVKTRSSPSVYTTFMHILYLYKEHALPSDEVDREVEVLFTDSCDLLEEFDCLRPNRAAPVMQSPLHPRHSALEVSELQREQQSERLQQMCEDVAKRKRKDKGKGVVTEWKQPPPLPKRVSTRLAKELNALGNRRSSRSKAEARHPQRPTHTTPATVTKGQRMPKLKPKNAKPKPTYKMYIGRAMCTPNYLLVKPPKSGDDDSEVKAEVSVHRAKSVLNEECELVQSDDDSENDDSENEANAEVSVHRSELAKSVLNEECVLVRKTEKFGNRIDNPYEKALFKCEYEKKLYKEFVEKNQYESDMIIKKYEVITKSCLNYLLKLQEPNGGELPPIREFLSPMHKKCIQKMYGDHAPAIMKALDKNPGGGLHVLLNRLILQLESMKSLKAKITPKWVQVYKNNFHLSLNHGSIDCKSKMKFKNINNLETRTNRSCNRSNKSYLINSAL